MKAANAKPGKNGGRREGAGRKPRGAERATKQVNVALSPDEHATLLAALHRDDDGNTTETLTDLLREGALALARRRLVRE